MKTDYKNRTAIILKGDIEQGNSALWQKWFQYSNNLFESLGLPSTHYGVDGEDFRKVTGIRTAKRFKKKIHESISENHSINYLEIYHYPDNELTIYPKNCPLYLSRCYAKLNEQGYIFLEFLSETINMEQIDVLIKELSEYIIVTSREVVECISSSEVLVNRLFNHYSDDESESIFIVKKIISKEVLR